MSALLLAVDGGNSKTDVLIVGLDGEVKAAVRGPTTAPFHVGLVGGMDRLGGLIAGAREAAGVPDDGKPLRAGTFALAGADLPFEEAELARAVEARGWVLRSTVRNDAFAVLRAGTDAGWGVGVVCGSGINAAGVGRDGREVRFPALGTLSGDWGGGWDVGMAALGAAVRAIDGRGPQTVLREAVPAYFGFPDAVALVTAVQLGELPTARMTELAPAVFDAVRAGDPLAEKIVDRLADEVVAIAVAAIRRLDAVADPAPVVLGGSLLRAGLERLDVAVLDGITAAAPLAEVTHPDVAPVVGAALLALDDESAEPGAAERVHAWGRTSAPTVAADS